MKISSINSFNNLKNQNFTGLWAKTTLTSDMDPALGIIRVQETSYYFPFKDENPKVASIFVEGNKHAHIEEDTECPRYLVNDCRLCATLPFTQKEYEQYKALQKGTRLNDTFRQIHSMVPRFYENKTPGEQTSAINLKI